MKVEKTMADKIRDFDKCEEKLHALTTESSDESLCEPLSRLNRICQIWRQKKRWTFLEDQIGRLKEEEENIESFRCDVYGKIN